MTARRSRRQFAFPPPPFPPASSPSDDESADDWQHVSGPLARILAAIARRSGFEFDAEDGRVAGRHDIDFGES